MILEKTNNPMDTPKRTGLDQFLALFVREIGWINKSAHRKPSKSKSDVQFRMQTYQFEGN